MAMASKAKGLLRELKTLKAEQSFLKNHCAQLEEENRQLREGAYQGDDFVSFITHRKSCSVFVEILAHLVVFP